MMMKFDFKDVWDKHCELYFKLTDLSSLTILRGMSRSHNEAQNLTVMLTKWRQYGRIRTRGMHF